MGSYYLEHCLKLSEIQIHEHCKIYSRDLTVIRTIIMSEEGKSDEIQKSKDQQTLTRFEVSEKLSLSLDALKYHVRVENIVPVNPDADF